MHVRDRQDICSSLRDKKEGGRRRGIHPHRSADGTHTLICRVVKEGTECAHHRFVL